MVPPNGLRFSCRRRRTASENAKIATILRAEGGQLQPLVRRQPFANISTEVCL
jgi:hypothetical protein